MHVHRALFGAALALVAAAAPAMAQLLPVEGDAQRADAFTSESNRSLVPGFSSLAGMMALRATMRFMAICRAL